MNLRKIHKIWYVIWIAIGISFFISGCPFKSGIEGKAWFQHASKYDQARSKMIANAAAKKETFTQDFTRMDKMERKFLRAKQPTETEIISVLRSPNRRFQRVGLAAMFLKPIETDQLIEILFEFIQDQETEFEFYALLSLDKFTKFPESKKADLGKQLLEIVKTRRRDNEFYIQDYSLLAKFPSEEAALFLTEQLMKEGKGLIRAFRYTAFRALKEMGNSFYDEAAEYVNKHGSPEIKEELRKREKAWDLYKETDFSAKIKNCLKK
ncbi:MAG: hypothetical protein WBC22_09560 [Sedimentisphaerales bacterium]